MNSKPVYSAQKKKFCPSLNSIGIDIDIKYVRFLNNLNKKGPNAPRKSPHIEGLNKMSCTLGNSSKKALGAPIKPKGRFCLSQEDIEESQLLWKNSIYEFLKDPGAPKKRRITVCLSKGDIEESQLLWKNPTLEFKPPGAPKKRRITVCLSQEDIEESRLFLKNSICEFLEAPGAPIKPKGRVCLFQEDIEELKCVLSNKY